MLIHQIQFQAFVHNVDSTSINGQTVTIHPQDTLSVESSFQHHFTLSQSHSMPTHFHFCCCWRYTRVQHKFLFPERFFGAISNPTATGPSPSPFDTDSFPDLVYMFFFFRNRTLWSHSPARWFESLFSPAPTFHQDPPPFPPPLPLAHPPLVHVPFSVLLLRRRQRWRRRQRRRRRRTKKIKKNKVCLKR